MKHKFLIIFSAVVVFAIIFVSLIYLYQTRTGALVDKYVAKITVCGNISSEAECWQKDFCEGVYGPSCPTCQETEFQRCQQISDKIAEQRQAEETVCQNSGGQWYHNKLGYFCLCDRAGVTKTWSRQLGCIDK